MSTFAMQEQELDQWCWAAVAVSLVNYIKPKAAPDQCELATQVLQIPGGCCGNNPACDQPASLKQALNVLNRHAGDPIVGPVSFAQIRQTIDAGWPIPVRIVWDDNAGNAHFVVISGYAVSPSGVPQVQVDDPFYGRSVVEYNTFVSSYHGSGQWERTYRVA
jgi:hypothetical protein